MSNNYSNKSYLFGGAVLLLIGVLWLISSLGIVIPKIVLSYPTFIILIGLLTLIQTNFKSEMAWAIFFFGNVLMLNRIYPDHNITQIGISIMFIGFGGYFLLSYLKNSKKSE